MIVDILKRRYVELEHMAVSAGGEKSFKLSMDVKIERDLDRLIGQGVRSDDRRYSEAPLRGTGAYGRQRGRRKELQTLHGCEDRTRPCPRHWLRRCRRRRDAGHGGNYIR